MGGIQAFDNAAQDRLLRALAEQLKVPLIQIARQAELAKLTDTKDAFGHIEYTADMGLRLIDSYLLSVQLQAQPMLQLEPVSVSAVLQDTVHRLNHLAKQYDCELEVHLSGKYEPVMANRESLEAAFATLGYAFIESVPPADSRHRIVLAAHRSSKGLVAGVFSEEAVMTSEMFGRAKALYGSARQPAPGLSGGSGAGLFVADSLLASMASPLRMARHQKLSGLAATFLPSQQLQLI